MTISASIVGIEVGPVTHEIDARWLMAYAAGLGLDDERYYDTRRSGGPVAHPLFSVCYEWPVALEIRAKTIPDAVATLSVHATHHLVIHRPPRAGDTLLTSACVTGVQRRRAGTLVTTRFTTVDARGAPVTTTEYGSVYRGVDCDREAVLEPVDVGAWTSRRAHHATSRTREPATPARWADHVQVAAGAAHVYTECARIWNPIHTDVAVATAAGLPAIILHGTATLALAVSRVLAHDVDSDPTRVHEVSTRFTGMVRLPSTFVVHGLRRVDDTIAFGAVDAEGRAVLSDALLAVV